MNEASRQIAEKTLGELRGFIQELLDGTSKYKSLYNLTEQIASDYANRFLIELLQNGYDAVAAPDASGLASGAVRMVLHEKDDSRSLLYVANNETPISLSNFMQLANFGQSDKNPQTSVGNKGIGFRSVLQVCSNPHIYSGLWVEGRGYDGFCFKFDPVIKEKLLTQVTEALSTPYNLSIELHGITKVLADSNSDLRDTIKARIGIEDDAQGMSVHDYVSGEYKYLSPYTLPIPIDGGESDAVLMELGRAGYVTVIKLELNQAESLQIAKSALRDLRNRASVLFLDRLRELSIVHIGSGEENLTMNIKRTSRLIRSEPHIAVREVGVQDSTTNEEDRWWMWSTQIDAGNHAYQSRLMEAVNGLPLLWKEVNEVRLEIAVSLSDTIRSGLLYIFLPTRQKSGFNHHINAPFYGEINRKAINIDNKYNHLLLEMVGELIYNAVTYLIEDMPPGVENMIADLLCPTGEEEGPHSIVLGSVAQCLSVHSLKLDSWNVVPFCSETGDTKFGTIRDVCVFPSPWDYRIFSRKKLAMHAGLRALSVTTPAREAGFERLAQSQEIEMRPKTTMKVSWAEQMARFLRDSCADLTAWNGFYQELISIVPDPDSLQGRYILLGDDGALYQGGAGDGPLIFLSPVQSLDQQRDSAYADTESRLSVPNCFLDKIVFFNSGVDLSTTNSRNRELAYYLADRGAQLVERFRVESILDKVILPNTPTSSVSYKKSRSKDLWQVFFWALGLYHNSARELDSVRTKFGRIMVPCQGGWYPANQAYFSRGWDGADNVQNGELLSDFFDGQVKDLDNTVSIKLLLNPKDARWRSNSVDSYEASMLARFLSFSGVEDALRLVPINTAGSVGARGRNRHFYNLAEPDKSTLLETFRFYKSHIVENERHTYIQDTGLIIENALLIEGYPASQSALCQEARLAFARLIAASTTRWPDNWHTCRVTKVGSGNYAGDVESPLAIVLKKAEWVPVGRGEEMSFFAPQEVWHVPSGDLSRPYMYSFIPFMEPITAKHFEQESDGLSMITRLGVNPFKFNTISQGVRLLSQLADSVGSERVPSEHLDYFKGHYYAAWEGLEKIFTNAGDLQVSAAPEKLVTTGGTGRLHVVPVDSAGSDASAPKIYIPDDKGLYNRLVSNRDVRILMIRPSRRSSDMLCALFGDSLVALSSLRKDLYVDQKLWTEQDAGEVDTSLVSMTGEWLLAFVMCVVSFNESQTMPVGGRRFREIVSLVRRVKLKTCSSIETALMSTDGDVLDSSRERIAFSLDTETFFVNLCDELPHESLARPISEYLDIAHLLVHLQLSLSKLEASMGAEAPSLAQQLMALQSLNINERDYYEVQKALTEDVAWSLDRLEPVLAVYNPIEQSIDIALLDVSDAEMLKKWLMDNLPEEISADQLLDMAQKAASDREMGRLLFQAGYLSLVRWNRALERLGRQTINNPDIGEEFESIKSQLRNALFAVIRHSVRDPSRVESYVHQKMSLEKLVSPPEWNDQLWQLEFDRAAEVFIKWLEDESLHPEAIGCFAKNGAVDDVADCIFNYFEHADLSPEEIARRNHKIWSQSISSIHITLVAALQMKGINVPTGLEVDSDILAGRLIEERSMTLELMLWTEEMVLEAIADSGVFKSAEDALGFSLVDKTSCEDVANQLGVSDSDLDRAKESQRRKKEEEAKRRRSIRIGSQEFDTQESNLGHLYDVIKSELGFDIETEGSLDNPVALVSPGSRSPGTSSGRRQGIGRPRASNSHIEGAIGYAGEIQVFEALKRMYKSSVIERSWKSAYSAIHFPGNECDDTLGYDFAFVHGGKNYYIEVKATMGDENRFEMGSSETRAAMRFAHTSKSLYLVAFVKNVVTAPHIIWLPNPFSKSGQSGYTIREAGARISFRLE